MAKCNVCSAEIPDGSAVCEKCGNNVASLTDNIWANPNAVKAPEQPKPAVEQITHDESPVARVTSAEAEIERKEKRTDYFNSFSGVNETAYDSDFDDDSAYMPTGLFEVPFNDTPYSLGYTIPKMHFSMSKSAKRKVIISSSVIAALSIAIVAIIVLNSVFGFLPKVYNTPVVYSKSGKVYMTTTKGKLPEEVNYSGTPYQIASGIEKIRFSPYNEDMFVVKNYSSKTNTYSLYWRQDMKVSTEGKLIDSNIFGDYKYVLDGKAIVYLKSFGTNDLYMFTFDSGESKLVERNVTAFGMTDNNGVYFITKKGDIKKTQITSTGFDTKQLIESAESIYLDSEQCNSFFYIKNVTDTGTGTRHRKLFRYSDGKSNEISNDVSQLITYSCCDNWVYYLSSSATFLTVGDLIIDDCLDADNETMGGFIPSVGAFTDDMISASRRNSMRKNSFDDVTDLFYMSLSYYDGKKSQLISDHCSDVVAYGNDDNITVLNTKTQSFDIYTRGVGSDKKSAIIYHELNLSDNKPLMSELPVSVLNVRSVSDFILDEAIAKGSVSTLLKLCVSTAEIVLTQDSFSVENWTFANNCKKIYMLNKSNESEYGDLMCSQCTNGVYPDFEPIAMDVEKFAVMSDGAVVYVNSDDTAFIGSAAIANRVSSIVLNKSKNILLILSDTNDSGSRLLVYKDGNVKAIADNVKSVVFNSDNSISFIKDFDSVSAVGDLYVSDKLGTPSRIDTGVSLLVPLSYE